jgi:hypothetical protein
VTVRLIAVPAVLVAAVVAIALVASGGGGSSDESAVPGGADPDAVAVIKSWSDELRAGDIMAASQRFAVPSVVQNGTPALVLDDRSQVEEFNRSLPCGAKLTDATSSGRFVIATFELTERPGPGECGAGVGETAKTAFVIHNGRITEWRRVVDVPGGAPTSTEPVV